MRIRGSGAKRPVNKTTTRPSQSVGKNAAANQSKVGSRIVRVAQQQQRARIIARGWHRHEREVASSATGAARAAEVVVTPTRHNKNFNFADCFQVRDRAKSVGTLPPLQEMQGDVCCCLDTHAQAARFCLSHLRPCRRRDVCVRATWGWGGPLLLFKNPYI